MTIFNVNHRMTKPTIWPIRPAKTQISLGIRPVWSESSLCAQWVAQGPSFRHADVKGFGQTGRMPRLIWVFAGAHVILLVLSCGGSYSLIFPTLWLMQFSFKTARFGAKTSTASNVKQASLNENRHYLMTSTFQQFLIQLYLMSSSQTSRYIRKCIRMLLWLSISFSKYTCDHFHAATFNLLYYFHFL